jgi:hypothetical protein
MHVDQGMKVEEQHQKKAETDELFWMQIDSINSY